MISDELSELTIECDRATEEFLALDWGYAKTKVRRTVTEMLSGSRLYTSSMAWLLKETTKMPVQVEPARKLHDLVTAITLLRTRKVQLEFSPA